MFFWRRVAPQVPEDGLKPTATPGYSRNFRDLNRLVSEGKSFSGNERNPLFLNLRGQGFVDISNLLGVDFSDDSRAVATADWDGDGDLDLWVTGRTAPRLRLLRNNTPAANSFVAIRLSGDGTTSNRDAIGARLALWEASEPELKQIRTVHAGDGFLAQSSRWVHFGVGSSSGAFELSVAWPGGRREVFTGLEAGSRYSIEQGGKPVEIARDPLPAELGRSESSGGEVAEVPGTRGVWCAERVPFPELSYVDGGGKTRSTTELRGKPVLVTLWATWCAPCLAELRELGENAEALGELGATVLALNVDGLALEGSAPAGGDAKEVLERIGYGLAHGFARQEGLGKVQVLIEFLTSRRGGIALPTSFLIDGEGDVAAFYTEAPGWERISADLGLLEAPAAAQLGRVSPRPGRWFVEPRQKDRVAFLGDYATLFATSGFPEESQRLYGIIKPEGGTRSAQEYYNLAKSAAQQRKTEQAIEFYRSAIRLDPDYGQALSGLGALLLMQKRVGEAEALFEKALTIDPNHATALVNLAMIDQSKGDTERALQRLRKVVARNPEYGEARFNLGSLLAMVKRHEEAIPQLLKAVELMPGRPVVHLNLAAAYSATEKWSESEHHYGEALRLNPQMGHAYFGLGVLQAKQGRHGEAAGSFQKVLSLGGPNPQAFAKLGQSLLASGEKLMAKDAFERALKLDPKNPVATEGLQTIAGREK